LKDRAMVTIDFLVGFTIFISAFIIVVAMVPHTLFAVQSARIDYDAVAYRTGVILVEDPGMPTSPDFPVWEQQIDPGTVIRMGLAVERGSSHILSPAKVDRFFDTGFFTYPDDYQRSLIFGDYPYSFNVTLSHKGEQRSVGPTPPEQYGVVRRVVVVKETSSLIRDGNVHHEFHLPENLTGDQRLTIEMPCPVLIDRSVDPFFRIDPRTDPLRIEIRNIRAYLNVTGNETEDLMLDEIRIARQGITIPFSAYTLEIDGNEVVSLDDTLQASEPVSDDLIFTLHTVPNSPWRQADTITITFIFPHNPDGADRQVIIYDYINATIPPAEPGILEVVVW